MDQTKRRHHSGQHRAGRTTPPALSPLGALYASEVRRLERRWPNLEPERRAYLVTLSLARIFRDVTRDELALAMREGDAWLQSRPESERAEIRDRIVEMALAVAG